MSTNIACTKEDFLETIKYHQLTIVKDDGVHRHLQMRSSTQGWNRWYDIVTFPEYLVYVGDMGSYVFRRLPDMFNFFRSPNLAINVGYWAEKCEAEDRNTKIKEFDVDTFRTSVLDYIRDYFDIEDDQIIDPEILEEFSSVLNAEDEYECVTAIRDFSSYEYPKFHFTDFWERGYSEYTYHFIWGLYAICYTINKYDEEIKK